MASLEVTTAAQTLNEEVTDYHNLIVGQRVSMYSMDMIAEADPQLAGSGASAGDSSSTYRQGVWMSGFASKTHQKSYGSVVGYNSKSTGGTLGIDTKISESCLLGLAATQAHSVLKHFDSLGGNKTSGSNSVISLYGLKELHGHWAVQGNAAYGWSNSNSVAIRRGRTKTVAYAKHKSDFFSGAMQLGKRLHVESLVIDPMVGVSYSQFNDKGYKEYGLNIVPWYVAKRFSYNIEGLIGARFSMPYHAHSSDWRYVPSISSYAL